MSDERSQQEILDELGEARQYLKFHKDDYRYAKKRLKSLSQKEGQKFIKIVKEYESNKAREESLLAELNSKQLDMFEDFDNE